MLDSMQGGMFGAITWDVDPAIFSLLGREVRWYGLLFAFGLLIIGPMVLEKIWKREKLSLDWMNTLYIYVVVATVVGARLGHVLFYNPAYYLANPVDILKVWEGGLASHGGTIGILVAVWLFSRRVTRRSVLFTLDRLAVPTGLVAAMIRMGNLMNSEIFGDVTERPWGFRFLRSEEYRRLVPDGILGCHPTQIYEAIAYLLTFALCMWLYWRRNAARRYEGLILGWFFVGIFGSRFFIEGIKQVQEPWEIDMIATWGVNMGQALSIPFVVAGVWLIVRALRRPLCPQK